MLCPCSYIRHIQLNMTNYINSEYQNVTPFSLPLPISDPGDPHVDHGRESQAVGLVLCPASTNKLRTSHAIVHIRELDLLLEPTIFGMAISGSIPDRLRSTARNVSVSCAIPYIIKEVSPISYPKEQTTPEHSFPIEGNIAITPGISIPRSAMNRSGHNGSTDLDLLSQAPQSDCIRNYQFEPNPLMNFGLTILMFTLTFLVILPCTAFIYMLVTLCNIYISVTRDFSKHIPKASAKNTRHHRSKTKGKVYRHYQISISVLSAYNRKGKFNSKVRHLVLGHHKAKVKFQSKSLFLPLFKESHQFLSSHINFLFIITHLFNHIFHDLRLGFLGATQEPIKTESLIF